MLFKHRKIWVVHKNDEYLGELSSDKAELKMPSKLACGLMAPHDDFFVPIKISTE